MATGLAAGEILVLATEDDRFGRFNSENREDNYRAIRAYRGKTSFSTEGFKDFETVLVVLDGSSVWVDWHHCILYSTYHSSLPEKEQN